MDVYRGAFVTVTVSHSVTTIHRASDEMFEKTSSVTEYREQL